MSSKPIPIGSQGVYAQLRRSDTEYDESENNMPVNCSSSYSNSLHRRRHRRSSAARQSISSSVDFPNENLLLPFLSSIYTEIIDHWCQIDWLQFVDNQQMTFLVLNPTIKDDLTVQTALDQHQFTIPRVPLLNQPECLLIRTEYDQLSLLAPNANISLESFFYPRRTSSRGKLMAMICHSKNMKIMFYKALSGNDWAVFCKDQKNFSQSSARILFDEEQKQLNNILKQEIPMNLIESTELSFPLSTLFNHPIIFVYIVQ